MIKDFEILNDIKEIRKKTKFLANTVYNNLKNSDLWKDIDKRLHQIEQDIEKN